MGLKIGVRREDKNQWERRVPITPDHVKTLIQEQGLDILVQPSEIRVFKDDAYLSAGARVQEDMSDCDLIFAVKEIPISLLQPNKTYIYFSHTIKGQPYNMEMLKLLIEKKCTLIDYERIMDEKGRRLIFFGRHAGLAGMIETLWCYGKQMGGDSIFAQVKQTYQYPSLKAAKEEIALLGEKILKEGLIEPMVVGFTGYGNVSQGAQEIIDLLPTEEIKPEDMIELVKSKDLSVHKIYKVVFKEEHLVKPKDPKGGFDLQEYYDFPEKYQSQFYQYAPFMTILMNCVYWDTPYPRLLTKKHIQDLFDKEHNLKTIGDISCDIDGGIECTYKATTPDNPVYIYDPKTDAFADGVQGHGVVIMAVDNLPCELPREASETFSTALTPYIKQMAEADYTVDFRDLAIPDDIRRGMVLYQGQFTPEYLYMKDFIA